MLLLSHTLLRFDLFSFSAMKINCSPDNKSSMDIEKYLDISFKPFIQRCIELSFKLCKAPVIPTTAIINSRTIISNRG